LYSPGYVQINPKLDYKKQGENEVYQRIEMIYDPEPDPDADGAVLGQFEGFVYNEGSLGQLRRHNVISEIDVLNASTKVV